MYNIFLEPKMSFFATLISLPSVFRALREDKENGNTVKNNEHTVLSKRLHVHISLQEYSGASIM